MKCDKCGASNVVTKIVIQNDKGTEEVNLCPVCFQAFVKDHPAIKNDASGRSLNDFLLGALNYINNGLLSLNGSAKETQADARICPSCSTPALRIKNERTAGCPKCYISFSEEIGQYLFGISGKTYSPAEKTKDIEVSLDSLKKRLKEAVKTENYEIAAYIRDEIKKHKQLSGGSK